MTDALTFLNIVQDQLGLAELPKLSDRFVADLGCDSLDMIELVMAAEDEFSIDVDVDDDEAEKLTTVQEAIDYIAARLAQA